MAVTLQSLLKPQVILDTVSRIGKGQGRLGKWLGFHYGLDAAERGTLIGPAGKEVPQRDGVYHIYNRTRTVATGRAPGVGPATIAPQPIGRVPYTLMRSHEKIAMEYEHLSNLGPIMGPNTAIDSGGQQYMVRQMEFLAGRFNNLLELMAASLFRGTLYLRISGDDWIPTLTAPGSGAYVTINFQLPAGNLNQLNMLGAGNIVGTTWSNAAAPIITNLGAIFDAYGQLSGYTPTDAWVSPTTWNYIISNTQVINQGGSVNTPFDEYSIDIAGERGGSERVATLRAYPMLRWHIVSDVLVLDGTDTTPAGSAGTGTITRVIPDNVVVFMPPVSTEWVDLLHYGEYVSEAPGMPAAKRPSYHVWKEYRTQPTVVEVLALMNVLPRLSVPSALAIGTVVF
jgi:hypothetical protein